ncbi:MAG TPA: YncE family protein, partial [Thermoanaerobaculia bacterium]|nr:YncE family protein [Thermoanaerobaculia bacterium]
MHLLFLAFAIATGVQLDPAGSVIDLGSMPIGMAVAPGGDKIAVVLSGWREQGVQIVDVKTQRVTQTLTQPAAFLGAAFSSDKLFVSGGNDDSIFVYAWKDGTATFDHKIALGKSRYPAGIAISSDGKRLYVAENVADQLAVIDL